MGASKIEKFFIAVLILSVGGAIYTVDREGKALEEKTKQTACAQVGYQHPENVERVSYEHLNSEVDRHKDIVLHLKDDTRLEYLHPGLAGPYKLVK